MKDEELDALMARQAEAMEQRSITDPIWEMLRDSNAVIRDLRARLAVPVDAEVADMAARLESMRTENGMKEAAATMLRTLARDNAELRADAERLSWAMAHMQWTEGALRFYQGFPDKFLAALDLQIRDAAIDSSRGAS